MASSIARAHVEASGGDLVVSWELDGDDVGVDIAVGSSARGIDHEHAVTVARGERRAVLAGVRRPGLYVSLSPHGEGGALITGERLVPFEGTWNFRDMGGYRVVGGGHVCWGKVFRADSLHQFSQSDLTAVKALGVKQVFDLRGDEERKTNPSHVVSMSVPITSRPAGESIASAVMPTLSSSDDAARMLRDMYLGILQHSAPQIGRIFGELGSGANLPAVFHCHAGKDRAGTTAALLLSALGVARTDVLDDYELTNTFRVPRKRDETYNGLIDRGVPPDAAAGILHAPRWAMEEALESLDADHGGIEAFLTGPGGMTPAQLDSLRAVLTQI